MAELLAFLDDRVGTGNYSLIVTADHGICPLPEVSAKKGIDAKRVDFGPIRQHAEEYLSKQYGKPIGGGSKAGSEDNAPKGKPTNWIESLSTPWVYLNDRQIAARKLDKNTVTQTLAKWLRTQPGIDRVYTANDLKHLAANDAIDRFVKASFYPERSGDLYVLLKPYYLFSAPLGKGTTHGSPYDYDRHVPLVLFGPGLPKGEQTEPVTPQHTAVILADYLGVKPPRDAIVTMPKSLMK
jgi:hypothetical protein